MLKIDGKEIYFLLFVYYFIGIITGLAFPDSLEKEDKVVKITSSITLDYTNYILAKEYIKKSEGLMLEPYFYSSHWYIGYGYQIFKPCKSITEFQADSLLDLALQQKIFYVSNKYKVIGNQALALGMLFYAIKPTSIKKSVLHKELLSTKNDSLIQKSWLSFCYYEGKEHKKLKKRREFEVNLFYKK